MDEAYTKGQLRTRVSFKEGICFKTPVVSSCAAWMREQWPLTQGMKRLWFDTMVTQGKGGLTKAEHESMCEEQRVMMAEYETAPMPEYT